jgi:hypothetical protein
LLSHLARFSPTSRHHHLGERTRERNAKEVLPEFNAEPGLKDHRIGVFIWIKGFDCIGAKTVLA